jgi:hypothetical protein
MIIDSLTLTKKSRVIDNITLFETIDINILDKLINSKLLMANDWDDSEYSNEREQLKAYRKNISNGKAKVKYNRVKDVEFGRVSPFRSLGLHTIRRAIRHTLAKNKYVDIDIVNCHPELLYQVCFKHNIKCKYLEKYVKNRETILNDVIKYYNVDKAIAKNLFIILIYFGTIDTWINNNKIKNSKLEIPEYIENLIDELKEIGIKISNENKELNKLIEKRKKKQNKEKYNYIGSSVSYFLQEIECEILEIIYNYCIRNEIILNNNCVLCADGLMIDKDKYNENLLTEFHNEIINKTGFNINFIKKNMDEDYLDILDKNQLTEKENKQLVFGDDYIIETFDKYQPFNCNKLIKLFNEDTQRINAENYIKYFHLTNSFNYFNFYHAEFYLSNKVYNIKDIDDRFENFTDYEKSIKQLFINHEKKEIKFTTLYLKSQYKNIYSSFDFEPNKKIDNDRYNLFKGFYYENGTTDYNQDIVNLFINHINYICKGEKLVVDYVISWFAHIFQKPEIKIKVALVFYSFVEGIGKNIMLDIISKLLKGYTGKFKDTEAITDKFNGDLYGKLFVQGDEINTKAQKVANELKDIITREKESIEFKNKDKMQNVKDYKNYAFTTNNENVFKITNTERRFCFIECPDDKKGEEYYKLLFDILNDDEKLRSMYNYLKTFNINCFNPRDIPKTEYKKNLIFQNLPTYLKFIKDDISNFEGLEYKAVDLYRLSVEFGKKNKMLSSYSEKFFYTHFKKVFGAYNIIKNKISVYSFPDDLSLCINDLIKIGYVDI